MAVAGEDGVMDWSLVGKKLAEIGLPVLGSVLPIPGGAEIGKAMAGWLCGDENAPENEILKALESPDGRGKAAEFFLQHQQAVLQIRAAAAAQEIQEVNETMRAEASAAHWPTWTWRPFIGFVTGVMLLGVYFLLPLLHISPPSVPQEVWVMLMAILGVASWGHSKALADPSNTAVTKG
ncbi:MAG: hypothetical protein HQL97_01220 [Magnetococcales bacterium]|nr:hypothetical protein [Magnetococcales bacterium]